MKNKFNVLSLFDGISCGKVALDNLGVKYNKYFASEIDKYAMRVAKHNHPDIIHVGNVTEITAETIEEPIHLLIGGSPCQGFSSAGKQLNFNDSRSKLFFEFVRLLKELKPTYFLLENVKMKKEYQDIISELLGVQPIEINSALVSAQNRKRLYWTNIPNISPPTDLGISLSDILETEVTPNFIINKQEVLKKLKQFHPRIENISMTEDGIRPYQGDKRKSGISELGRLLIPSAKKSYAITTTHPPKLLLSDLTFRKLTPVECERLQTLPDNYTECVSKTQRYKMLGNGWTVKVIEHLFKGLKIE